MWAVRASRSYLTPVVTKKIGMKIPKPAASSLRRKSGWVMARSRSTSEMIAPAMKAPRMTSSPSSVASATSPMSRTKAARMRICAVVSCRRRRTSPRRRECSTPAIEQRDEHGDHEQPAEQDDLRRGGARLAREEEREQDHGGEVGDRARGDDELPEGRADLVRVLEHRHEHAQRGGRQHDGHEQRLGGQAARLQRQPHDDREDERDGEAQQREPQDAPAQALEVDLQAGEEEQVGQPDGREDLHGVVHVDPPEHRGPHDDPEHDLDHDRRDAHGRHEAERRAGRRSRSRR